jgi:glycosyltransferase involved in cell wall biosynthesis
MTHGGAPTKSSAVSLCFVINYDYRVIGGAMTRFRQEVEYFSSKSYPVTVVYSSHGTEKFFRKERVNYYNMHHIRHDIVILAMRQFFRCLKQYLSSRRLTFIAHNPISSIPPSLLHFIGLHPSTVLVMHGPSAIETYFKGKKAKAVFQSIIDRIAFALAGKIVAVSEYERNYAISLKVNRRKIIIIRNGIKPPKLTEHSSFRQEMGIAPEWVTIGYLGSWVAYRGTEFLIEAFSIAKAIMKTPLALVLVLKEKLTGEQIRKIKEIARPHSEAVYIAKPRKDISPILSTLDIYASHFSKKVDGIGFSIMEAMASGLPVITGKDSITNRLLKNGIDAILVDKENAKQIAEAIKRLAEDPLLRRKLGANAQKTAIKKFSRSHMLALCEREYLNVVPH